MLTKSCPSLPIAPPDPEPIDRLAWERAFIFQWRAFQADAEDLNIYLGLAEAAAEFSWENDGFERSGADAARYELLTRFDCICPRGI